MGFSSPKYLFWILNQLLPNRLGLKDIVKKFIVLSVKS